MLEAEVWVIGVPPCHIGPACFPPSPRPFLNQALPKSRLEFRNLKLCLSWGKHTKSYAMNKYSHTDPKGRPKHPLNPVFTTLHSWGMLRKTDFRESCNESLTPLASPQKQPPLNATPGFRAPKWPIPLRILGVSRSFECCSETGGTVFQLNPLVQ